MTDRVLEQENRYSGRQVGKEVGGEKGSAPILVGDVGKSPDIAEPDGPARSRENEAAPSGPLLSLRHLLHSPVGPIRWTHSLPKGTYASTD